ncbi:MAG: mechanosensitive ion channel family protein [Bacteroidota bacterium]
MRFDQDSFFAHEYINGLTLFCSVLALGLALRPLAARAISLLAYRAFLGKSAFVSFDEFRNLVRTPLGVLLLVGVLYSAFGFIHIPEAWHRPGGHEVQLHTLLNKTFLLFALISASGILLRLIDFFGMVTSRKLEDPDKRPGSRLHPFMLEALKILGIILSVCIILGTVFGLNIAGIVAGLGIGGIAVALAGKETLENFFAGLTIFLDKPFMIGDLVQSGSIKGIVEKVGFRSTRIRTLDKSFLTLPNKLLVDQAVDNLSLREAMRVRFSFNLPFSTDPDAVRKIVEEVQAYIDSHPRTGGEREVKDALVGFHDFDENAIRITVLYFLDTLDVKESSRTKEDINFRILEIVHTYEGRFHTIHTALTVPPVVNSRPFDAV